jgi:TRAP-type C4-dicarboxylate transport system permease small subunit
VSLLRLESGLRSALGFGVALLLAAISVICVTEVVLRYVLAASLSWYDELVGYLLVWLSFLGAVLAQSHGQHVGIGDLAGKAPPKARRLFSLGNHLVMVAVHLVLLVSGAELAARFLGERAITLPVPMGLVYGVIPVSAALMLAVEAVAIARELRS